MNTFQILLDLKKGSKIKMYSHFKGLFKSKLPYANKELNVERNTTKSAVMDLTVLNSVTYDGDKCNSDPSYRYDICWLENIHKVG